MQTFYIKSQQKKRTLQRLYENQSLTKDQIDSLKTAIAASEVIPLALFSPYVLVGFRLCLGANTGSRFLKMLVFGVAGFGVSDAASLYFAQKVWWPITAEVYRQLHEDPFRRDPNLSLEELYAFKNEAESFRQKVRRVWNHLSDNN